MNKISSPLLTALCCCASAASAQDRTDDNAVTQAADGFGTSVGRETIGIYNANGARGFSPTVAGNLRIEGLYFDPQRPLPGVLSDSSAVKVGISAQGYPFNAPSGVVDLGLRRPAAKAGASIVLNTDALGTAGVEIDGSLPVTSRLSLAYGVSGIRTVSQDGTRCTSSQRSLTPRPYSGLCGQRVLPSSRLRPDQRRACWKSRCDASTPTNWKCSNGGRSSSRC